MGDMELEIQKRATAALPIHCADDRLEIFRSGCEPEAYTFVQPLTTIGSKAQTWQQD